MEQFLLGQLLLVLLVAAGISARQNEPYTSASLYLGAAASSSSEMWVVHSSFYTTFPRSQITETSVQYSTVSAPLLPSPPPSTHLTPSQSPPHTTSPSIRSSSPGAGSTSSSVPFPSPKLESDKNFRLLLYTVPPLAFVLVVVTTLFLVSVGPSCDSLYLLPLRLSLSAGAVHQKIQKVRHFIDTSSISFLFGHILCFS